ncbi:hypothetical protein [Streptomyces prunicolor]|uniref:hypothetical protein n=1 Tax=Streptomyces prunicolor TaxID=67348 RepID=UPI000369A39F|nr:hypothetical protein [Streptomyces prunicolor]
MTATHVKGVTVVADEPARSPISRPGVNVVFDQIRHLLLADGSEWYGCLHCDYVSQNQNSIRPHLKAHKPKAAPEVRKPHKPSGPAGRTGTALANRSEPGPRRRQPSRSTPAPSRDLGALNLGELVQRARLTEQMHAQRDEALRKAEDAQRIANDWKSRADDWRLRFEGMKARMEQAEGTLSKVRAMVK